MSEIAEKYIGDVLSKNQLAGEVLADVPEEMQEKIQAMLPGASIRFAHSSNFPLFQSEQYGCIILAEALQRDENFFKTMSHVSRVLKDNGLLIITTAGMDHPRNSRAKWRFTPKSLEVVLKGFETIFIESVDEGKLICADARKKPKPANPDPEAGQNKELCHVEK